MAQLTQELYDALNRRGTRGRGRDAGDRPTATAQLCRDLAYAGLPAPELEYQFCPTRKWKTDLAWPALRLALEVEGLVYSNRGDNQLKGRHVSVSGFQKDLEKYNALAVLGWRLLRVTSAHARDGRALAWVEQAMSLRS